YLADRVNNGFRHFFVELEGFRDIEFRGWPAMLGEEKRVITDFHKIFASTLEILEANTSDNRIEVICNIKSFANSEFSGGELLFRADSAAVCDEANKEYSISELGEICKAYWSEWKTKNARHV